MVNGPDDVYVERGGRIEPTEVRFDVRVAPCATRSSGSWRRSGRRVDELSPMVDARLARRVAGQRGDPAALGRRAALSIRRFTAARPDPDELVASGTITAELRDLLAAAVGERRSILISGGTGSGKTTLLNALSTLHRPRRSEWSRSRTRPSSACASRTWSGSRAARRASRAGER